MCYILKLYYENVTNILLAVLTRRSLGLVCRWRIKGAFIFFVRYLTHRNRQKMIVTEKNLWSTFGNPIFVHPYNTFLGVQFFLNSLVCHFPGSKSCFPLIDCFRRMDLSNAYSGIWAVYSLASRYSNVCEARDTFCFRVWYVDRMINRFSFRRYNLKFKYFPRCIVTYTVSQSLKNNWGTWIASQKKKKNLKDGH